MVHQPINGPEPRPDVTPETIRRRLTLAFAAAFIILMGVAAIEGFWPSAGPGSAMATAFLVGCMVVVPVAMALLTRPVLRDIRHLASENARLRDLYGRARLDALLDGLTGLGNHRAFQEELARQLEHAGRTSSLLALASATCRWALSRTTTSRAWRLTVWNRRSTTSHRALTPTPVPSTCSRWANPRAN
jgi:hypothetical protein